MSSTKNQYVVTARIYDKRGTLLSTGRNSYSKTHPRMVELGKKVGFHNDEKIFIHAEMDAINKCSNLDKAYLIEVFVYSKRSNSYRKSRPCPICTLDIKEAKIPYIRYRDRRGMVVTVPSEDLGIDEVYLRRLIGD